MIIMKKHKLLVLILAFPFWLNAQLFQVESNTNVEIQFKMTALLQVVSKENVHLNLNKVNDAGSQIESASSCEIWLNYSVSSERGIRKKITVRKSTGNLPPGTKITMQAKAANQFGDGDKGFSTGLQILNAYEKTLIQNIGGAYTGSGIGKGHEIHFTLEHNDFKKLKSGNHSITVTYTILDD